MDQQVVISFGFPSISLVDRAVFKWVSKVRTRLQLLRLVIGLKSGASLSTNEKEKCCDKVIKN